MKKLIKLTWFKLLLGSVFYIAIFFFITKKGLVHNYNLLITQEGSYLLIFGVLIGIWIHSFITFAIDLIYKKGV